MIITIIITINALNGNSEVPVYFSKAKQGYTVRKKWEKLNGYSQGYVCDGMRRNAGPEVFRMSQAGTSFLWHRYK
jgi:hypothetical protein